MSDTTAAPSSPPPPGPGRPQPSRASSFRKPPWLRWWVVAAVALAVVITVGALTEDPKSATTTGAAPTLPTSRTASAITTPSTSASSSAATPTPTPTTAKPAAPPPPRRATYSGRGAKVLTIAKPGEGAALATITHKGSGNVAVWTLDAQLQERDLLVNDIGRYSGVVLLDADGGDSRKLKIEADGAWTVTISEVAAAPRFGKGKPATGRGDAVWIYDGDPAVITSQHSGRANFAVTAYGDGSFPDLIVNEIGAYKGEGTIGEGPRLVVVHADGPWTLRVS
ncbi:MAG: hypothetical protein U0Q15_04620 [Kineosporiaceae bacterium]